jgi:hypothetical protein
VYDVRSSHVMPTTGDDHEVVIGDQLDGFPQLPEQLYAVLARIHEEVKGRPRYLVKESIEPDDADTSRK